jgi:hypothetical protein
MKKINITNIADINIYIVAGMVSDIDVKVYDVYHNPFIYEPT